MIKTFAERHTQDLYVTGRSLRFPPDIRQRIMRKLGQLNAATVLGDLAVPPSNRLHALSGDREGQYSISVNMQWRICFVFHDGDVYDVEVCDYH